MRDPTQKILLHRQTVKTSKSLPKSLPNSDRVLVRCDEKPQNRTQLPPFDLALERAWKHAIRQGKVLSVLFLKLEYCPRRKASWEFRTKEQLCQQITRILRANLCNAEARIFRYSHRRFACILPGTNAMGVKSLCHLLPIALRAIGIVPAMGAAAVQPSPIDTDPYLLTRAAEAALYQAQKKKSLYCVLSATDPQFLARTAQTTLSEMPKRDRVWIKLSGGISKIDRHERIATLARERKTR